MSEGSSRFQRLLLVEDDYATQSLMQEAAKTAGLFCQITMMSSGEDALDYLDECDPKMFPQMILLDMNLPGKNGVETLMEIRQRQALKSLPAVILTGSNANSDIDAISQTPQCRYQLKPVHFAELVELFRNL